ncbi:helix-turn-helix domain-containing protein [Micromonospora sp. WMMD723]
MSESNARTGMRLRHLAAEEIRVLLARRRMSAAELARQTGIRQQALSRRMTGETAFDLDDLERIADVLGVTVADLLPTAQTTNTLR